MAYDNFDRVLAGVRTVAAVKSSQHLEAIRDTMAEQTELQERQQVARKYVYDLMQRLQTNPASALCYHNCVSLHYHLNSELWQETWFATDPATYDVFTFVQRAAAECIHNFESAHSLEVVQGLRMGIRACFVGISESLRHALKEAYANMVDWNESKSWDHLNKKYKIEPKVRLHETILACLFGLSFIGGGALTVWMILHDYSAWRAIGAGIGVIITFGTINHKFTGQGQREAIQAFEAAITDEEKTWRKSTEEAVASARACLKSWPKPTCGLNTEAETVKSYLASILEYTGKNLSLPEIAHQCETAYLSVGIHNRALGIEEDSLLRTRLHQLEYLMARTGA